MLSGGPGPHQHSLLLFCREFPSWLVTDFFWFLQNKLFIKVENRERERSEVYLVSRSSSAAASDLTAALSEEKNNILNCIVNIDE